jgi:hypothetical protein
VFLAKSAQYIQNTGVAPNIELQRVRKLLKRKEACFCKEIKLRRDGTKEQTTRAGDQAGRYDSNGTGIHELE